MTNRSRFIDNKLIVLFFLLCISSFQMQAQIKAQNENTKITSTSYLEDLLKEGPSSDYVITAEHISSISDIKHTYLRQAVNGIEVLGTESSIHRNAQGKVIQAFNQFVEDVSGTVRSATPSLSASEAIYAVAGEMGYSISGLQIIQQKKNVNREVLFSKAGISVSDIPVRLVYYLNQQNQAVLVWELSIDDINSPEFWWNFQVDATTGKILAKQNLIASCNLGDFHNHEPFIGPLNKPDEALLIETESTSLMVGSYNVFQLPIESPNHGGRSLISNPDQLGSGSPFGWHDTNGSPGSETMQTTGNNIDAFGDTTGNRAFGGASHIFNFGLDLNQPSLTQEDAALTNMFYMANMMHDITYEYGFTEAAGNFQENNYGNGGAGSDSVIGEGQKTGTCNAFFGTPNDGSNPTMQMYICNHGGSVGDRDGDFDNGVIAHEYGHGISNRLTGGPGASGCLGNQEQMGEGWSDFFGMILTIEPGDAGTDSRGMGTWLVGQLANGPGIRSQPYDTDDNTYTYDSIKTEVAPHGVGSVWAMMLWEMTWDLIGEEGFNADVYNGTGGNNIALSLVIEGLKLQPCSPGFVDGRDAILLADQNLYGGAYSCLIWEAFARRGLGFSASQGSTGSKADGTEAFDLPPGLGTPVLDTVSSLCISSGIQNGLGGGTPVGGVYSGIGVTDDANGTTFSFDPSVNGVGSVVVSYTITNLCTSNMEVDTDTIVVGSGDLEIICPTDINTCYPDVNYELPRPADGCFGRTTNRISQNNNETINNGVDCAGDISGHLRRFNLTTEGVVRDYLITGIEVGINSTTGANIIVNIYLDNTLDNAITAYRAPISNTVTPYASVTSAVPAGSNFVHTVPFDLFLIAGSAFTVEVISPASQDYMIGYNDSGVTNNPDATAAAYTSCASSLDYSDLVAYNLGENAVLIQVQGTESNSLTTTQTAGIATGETFPLGATTNSFETTDGTNTVSCSFDVNVYGDGSVSTYASGSWSPAAPTATTVAVFNDSYNTSGTGNSSIDACSCEIRNSSTVTVAAGDYMSIATDITVSGTLIVEHTANVVQSEDDADVQNDGTINVELTTPALNARDFMILGSPMTAEDNAVFNGAYQVLNHTTANFTPYVGVPPVVGVNFHDQEFNDWSNYTGTINPGEGYLVRPSFTSGGTYNYVYDQGTLNNGEITYNAYFGDDKEDSPNILSNPYASALDAELFINSNPIINEVYFWEHITTPNASIPGPLGENFSMEDISTYNGLMGIPASSGVGAPNGGTVPNGIIATGQGFGIKANSGGDVTFNNSMRLTSGNTTLRQSIDKDLIWLTVRENTYGMGSSTGIGFTENATAGLDEGFDTMKLGTVVSLYSHLQDGSEQLGIQGREAFDASITIPMGFSTLIEADSGIPYVISIDKVEGANIEDTTIYLVDHLLDITTNLSTDRYEFTSDAGTFDNRFTLRFERILSTNPEVTEDSLRVFPNPTTGILSIQYPDNTIKSAKLFDVQGRMLLEQSFENSIDPLLNEEEGTRSQNQYYTLDISRFNSAIYFVQFETSAGNITKQVIKE